MTDICQQVDTSMTGYDSLDLLRWLREGNATFYQSGDLHASLRYLEGGGVEVGHMAGKITDEDLAWVIGRARLDAAKRGCEDLKVHGRKGWERFLRMKGYL